MHQEEYRAEVTALDGAATRRRQVVAVAGGVALAVVLALSIATEGRAGAPGAAGAPGQAVEAPSVERAADPSRTDCPREDGGDGGDGGSTDPASSA